MEYRRTDPSDDFNGGAGVYSLPHVSAAAAAVYAFESAIAHLLSIDFVSIFELSL